MNAPNCQKPVFPTFLTGTHNIVHQVFWWNLRSGGIGQEKFKYKSKGIKPVHWNILFTIVISSHSLGVTI